MRDVNSSDIIPIWEDIRIEDMNKLSAMQEQEILR